MRVMRIDAFLSMVVYTIATIAFYLLGATVLHRKGMDPEDMRTVSTLAEAYVPVFGTYAKWLFLLGAFAVLIPNVASWGMTVLIGWILVIGAAFLFAWSFTAPSAVGRRGFRL